MFGMHRSSANLLARRKRHSHWLWVLEGLEDRVLLSPTLYTVNAITDTGAGSDTAGDLRYVINQANANPNTDGSLIQFDQTVFNTPQKVTLSSPLILSETNGPEAIDGPGANLVTISGNNAVEVFYVNSGVTANLSGLTISNGLATYGGGIENYGTLTVTNSTFDYDSAGDGGGGGIFNLGTLTVTNSTIANNSADDRGGGIYNGNILTVTNSTIANNSANRGGGIYSDYGTLMAVNDTIAYNTVASGGYSGGLNVSYGGTATLDNTIVALNTRAGTPDDIGGAVNMTNSYNNLIGTGGSGGLTDVVNGNQVGVVDPGLGMLADNGGPTQTIALLPGSPAVDAGNIALAVAAL